MCLLCDLFHGAAYASDELWGCPLEHCHLTLRHSASYKDHLSWEQLARLASAYYPKLAPCNLHAAKCSPLEACDNAPKSAIKKLKSPLARNGDDRCPNMHGVYAKVMDQQLG